jgi:two-component system NtrC family response regulator/two-component system nitrogen regulation response regulator GlnG
MGKILLVDDDDQLRDSFKQLLEQEGHEVRAAASGEAALLLVDEAMPDAVIMDMRMPGLDGLATLRLLRERERRLPVIIMTAYSTTDAAIEATKLGAFDYILKPFEIPDILTLLDRALEAGRVMRTEVRFTSAGTGEEHAEALVGVSRAMHEIYKAIGRAAPTDALVLLRGESGTGKELVARALYQHSARSTQPFSVINCVAIPDTLLESELFGYERGAFTGASSRRIGKIEQAEGGTVFLDEIGDIPLNVQAKLLRLLQEKQIERLGGREPVKVNVRIIAATNRDLEAAVSEGRFRDDLYYRLNVVTLRLPPLRERKEDISHLVRHFIWRLAEEMEIPAPEISAEALERLSAYDWPGNVRELANLTQKLIIFNQGGPITGAETSAALTPAHAAGGEAVVQDIGQSPLTAYVSRMLRRHPGEKGFDNLMDEMGAVIIREALALYSGNRSQTARMLGLSRPTLLSKIEKYGL